MYKFHKLLLTSAFSRFLTSVRSIYSFNTRLAPKSSFALPKSRTIDEHLKLSSLYLLLVIVLTRAAPALQYHFLFFFWVGLVVYSCVIFLLCCYGIAAQYFGVSNFASQNTSSVQNIVLRSAWGFFFAVWFNLGFVCSSRSRRSRM